MDYGEGWDQLRRRVYKRDDYTCQRCGSKGGSDGDRRVVAHHVIPRSEGGADELNNLVTLCHRCHARVHPENESLSQDNHISSGFSARVQDMYDDYDFQLPVHIMGNRYGVIEHRTKAETTVNIWNVDIGELSCDCPNEKAKNEACIHQIRALEVHPTNIYGNQRWSRHHLIPLEGECWAPACLVDFIDEPEDIGPNFNLLESYFSVFLSEE